LTILLTGNLSVGFKLYYGPGFALAVLAGHSAAGALPFASVTAEHQVAKQIRQVVEHAAYIADVDDSGGIPGRAPDHPGGPEEGRPAGGVAEGDLRYHRHRPGRRGRELFARDPLKYALPIRLEFPVQDKADIEQVRNLKLHCRDGTLVPMPGLVQVIRSTRQYTRYQKDLLPLVYVTGDMAGELDSPSTAGS
jgi:hypothetical protein